MSADVIQGMHIIVHVTGEIDISNVAEFNKALSEAAEKAPEGFIIDLTDATYMDSAGVQAILTAYSKMRESEGCLVVIIGNVRVKRVLEVVHLEQLPGLCIRENLDAAKQELSGYAKRSDSNR